MKKTVILTAVATALLLPAAAQAKQESRAVLSNKCDAAKLKSIAGGALVKIGPGPGKNAKIHTVTLDTSKLTFQQLTQKMAKAGCF
ncbi:MAG: hypothetical protein P8Z76_18000 [Alphaproteobacteria bacterium]|jgi:peptidyl-tRNA hydrolase